MARLGRPHGLDGHLGLYVEEADVVYFDQGKSVLIEDRPYTVRAIRRVDRGYQVQFEGVTSRQTAEAIRGCEIEVWARRELEPDEFWPEDLIGLEARQADGGRLGHVVAFAPGAAQDRVVIEIDGDRFEVPFITEFVPVVDIAEGYLEVRPIPGLIEPLA
ncbi:MAG TPA: ribosome maturation factor RimM [Acidimicrobiia bacterium]